MNFFLLVIAFSIFFVYILSKNQSFSLIIITFVLLAITSNNIQDFFINFSNDLNEILSLNTILLMITLLLTYILSELSNLIGLTHYIEREIFSTKNIKLNNIVSEFLQIFSNMFDLSSIDYLSKNREKFMTSSFINSTLLFFSVPTIFFLLFLEIINHYLTFDFSYYIFVMISLNVVAIWWIIKSFINHSFKYELNNVTDDKILNHLIPVGNSMTSKIAFQSKKSIHKIILTMISSFILFAIITVVLSINIIFSIVIYLSLNTIYFIVIAEFLVYKKNAFNEEDIFNAIILGSKTIARKILKLCILLLFIVSLNDVIYLKTNIFDTDDLITISSFIIILFTSMSIFKYYPITIALLSPYIISFINIYSAHSNIIIIFFVVISNVILLLQVIRLQKKLFLNIKMIIDLSILTAVTLTNIFIFYLFGNLMIFYSTFILEAILYAIIIYLLQRKNAHS